MSAPPPFRPAHAHAGPPPGCSDKTARSWAQREEAAAAAPKVTTAARASAALEAYWAARAAAGGPLAGDRLPGGERSSAHKTREACWRDSVHLEHDVAASSAAATWQGPPADLEEKERIRTRGVTGYTGRQPAPGASRPPPPPPDISRCVAINAFDEPRPRVKGISGYTGHQPPATRAATAAAAAALPGANTGAAGGQGGGDRAGEQDQQASMWPAASAPALCSSGVSISCGRLASSQHASHPCFFSNGVEVRESELPATAAPAGATAPQQQQQAPAGCGRGAAAAGEQQPWWQAGALAATGAAGAGAGAAVRPTTSPADTAGLLRCSRPTTYAAAFTTPASMWAPSQPRLGSAQPKPGSSTGSAGSRW